MFRGVRGKIIATAIINCWHYLVMAMYLVWYIFAFTLFPSWSLCHSVQLQFIYACYPHTHTYYPTTSAYHQNAAVSFHLITGTAAKPFLSAFDSQKRSRLASMCLSILIRVSLCQLLALMCLSIFLCVSLCPCRRPAFVSPKRSLLAPACLSIPKCVPLLVPTFLPTNGFQNPHSQNHNRVIGRSDYDWHNLRWRITAGILISHKDNDQL